MKWEICNLLHEKFVLCEKENQYFLPCEIDFLIKLDRLRCRRRNATGDVTHWMNQIK